VSSPMSGITTIICNHFVTRLLNLSKFEKRICLQKKKFMFTIDRLPDNLTIDQLIDEMILLDKIEQGINDADDGRVFTTDEVKDKLNKWLK